MIIKINKRIPVKIFVSFLASLIVVSLLSSGVAQASSFKNPDHVDSSNLTNLGAIIPPVNTAPFITSAHAADSHSITVDHGGDAKFDTITSGTLTQSVTSQSSVNSITTGNAKYDKFDSLIISSVNKYGFPDALVIKAMVDGESFFYQFAVSPDTPCGKPSGWTSSQSRSYGLLQITPTCNYQMFLDKGLLLSNGKPNLTRQSYSPLWATSVFNPSVNIDFGVDDINSEYNTLKINFPGCTEKQYIRMTLSSYNSGADSVLGCGLYNARGTSYVNYVVSIYNNELGPLVEASNKI